LNGGNSGVSYYSGLLLLIAILNLVGYILGYPLVFAWSAVIFWVCAPSLMEQADSLRRVQNKNDDQRAALAGIIILIIGSATSFFGVPSEGLNWNSIIDIFVLCIVAVCDIIGGAILANVNNHVQSAQVFIILCIFAIAIIFGSKSLMYAAMILATILWATLLPNAFNSNQAKKVTAGIVIAWIGQLITFCYGFFVIAVGRKEEDKFEENDGSSNKGSNNA
jgi:hypothetical protein